VLHLAGVSQQIFGPALNDTYCRALCSHVGGGRLDASLRRESRVESGGLSRRESAGVWRTPLRAGCPGR
jgi:hypothetical protein